MARRATFRELLGRGAPLVMPAAHDALSARLIERAQFPAMAISGSGVLAARYAMPDLGIAGLADFSAAARDIMAAQGLACMADGDDGYGDVKSVARTVRSNESMGIGALVIEDQARQVKRPGQTAALAVVPEDDIAAKLRVAVATRDDRDFWIVGRTDAYGALGIDAAQRRAELFLRCGVDGLFVAGVRDPGHLARIGRSFKGTPLAVVMQGGDDALSVRELHAMGYTLIVYPLVLLLPMCRLFADTLTALQDAARTGASPPPLADATGALKILTDAVELSRWQGIGETS